MTIPPRGCTRHGTYFATAQTFDNKQIFQAQAMARLLVDVLLYYRAQQKYLLHEFVVMPDHFHLLLTPVVTLERAMQFIKGGFSYRAKKELGFGGEVWQTSFYDRRVRDAMEYERFRDYIHQNPVKRRLVPVADQFPFSSANKHFVLDDVPQWLKPPCFSGNSPQA